MTQTIEIVQSGDTIAIAAVREFWTAYWNLLGCTPDFRYIAELSHLPGKYGPPTGRLLLARVSAWPVAAVGFRRLSIEACEAKHLYVDPASPHRGIGAAVMTRLIEEARGCGYRVVYGDTLPTMVAALTLYRKMGFVQTRPYSTNPTSGAIYLRLSL
jgi:GNAT superfamily N-acetyltransferase